MSLTSKGVSGTMTPGREADLIAAYGMHLNVRLVEGGAVSEVFGRETVKWGIGA